ncbi:MAG TPA: hypothetical protein VFG65_08185 [Fimbriimonadales bacterium]|jgi:hypothetical protein|nr:hypothetical protein [Fimbriimonadales bacterium]
MRIDHEEESYQEEVDRRARDYYESARAQGSLLPEEDLLTEARRLAERDMKHIEALADVELDIEAE